MLTSCSCDQNEAALKVKAFVLELQLDSKNILFLSICREESALSDLEVDYFDNAPCIELLTCQVCCTLYFLSSEKVNNYIYLIRVWIVLQIKLCKFS